jgi:hypothetical protein
LTWMMVVCLIIFAIGLTNNLFSYVTLKRPACLHTGICHYLLAISIINQISLAFLATRLLHLASIIAFTQSFSLTNYLLCKVFNFSLVSLVRLTSWFACLVAFERTYKTIHLTGRWFKTPTTAHHLMIIASIMVLLSGAYELVFVKLFASGDIDSGSMCVIEFPLRHQLMWTYIHQTVSIFHFILPVVINIGSTVGIIVTIIQKKMNIRRPKQCEPLLDDGS